MNSHSLPQTGRALAIAASLLGLAACEMAGPPAGRLTLSNLSFESAHVMAFATAAPDCNTGDPAAETLDFRLPLNGTRIVTAAPGSDVCWRREIEDAGGARRWSEWNRVFLSSAVAVAARL